MKLEINLVRHAETVANRDNILQGHCDYPLTEAGYELTRLTGDALANECWTLAYTSDLQRAATTANIIMSKCHTPVGIVPTILVRELNFGVREQLPRGTTMDEARAIVAKATGVDVSAVLDNAETFEEVTERQRKFIDLVFQDIESNAELIKASNSGIIHKILVLSHGGYIRSFLRSFCDKDHLGSIDKIKNCSVSKVIVEKTACLKNIDNFEYYFETSADKVNCVI